MKRILYKHGQWVVVKATGKKYQVEVDYEDFIWLIGIEEEFLPDQIKPV